MKFSQQCSCCWNKKTAYTYRLNKWLVYALIKLIEHGKPAKTTNLRLSKAQYWSFNKLQFRWLIEKNDKNERIPTETAKAFYRWSIKLYDTVAMLGREKLSYDHHARSTHKTKPKKVYIHQIVEVRYKQREEYQKEKRGLFWFSLDKVKWN